MPVWAGSVIGMNLTQTTAQTVAAAIATTGNTVAGVAASTLIPRSTLQRKIAGESEFTITELHKVARAIGKRTVDLLPAEVLAEAVAA